MQTREVIELDCEESHELLFRIQVEGNDVSPARVRLVCEGDEMSYMFLGRSSGEEGIVQFAVPTMKDKVKEGIHPARVEVLIDNKYFAPVQFDINFKRPVKVYAEALRVLPPVTRKPEVRVTAEAVVTRVIESTPRPIVIDTPSPAPIPPDLRPTDAIEPEPVPVKPTQESLPEPSPAPVRTGPVVPSASPVPTPPVPDPVVPALPPPSPPPTPITRPQQGTLRDRYQKRRPGGQR